MSEQMNEDWIEQEYNRWKKEPCYVPYQIDELMDWRAKSFALHILKKASSFNNKICEARQ